MIPRYSFAQGAQRAGRHPKGDGRLAALVLRATGYPVTHGGIMRDEDVEFLHRYAGIAIEYFVRARHEGAVESCAECAARDHDELGIRPEAHGVDLDHKAARRAGRRLAAEFLAAASAQEHVTEAEAA